MVKNVDATTDKVALKISARGRPYRAVDCGLTFEGVKIPEEARRFASGMGQQAMMMLYMKETAGELRGRGRRAAATGLGSGIGLRCHPLPQQMQQAQAQTAAQNAAAQPKLVVCPTCSTPNPWGRSSAGTAARPPAAGEAQVLGMQRGRA
jgi:membrane protease subunit (stomatin/prohibitin family)